jgi:trehalose 6-phosphate phosphatase
VTGGPAAEGRPVPEMLPAAQPLPVPHTQDGRAGLRAVLADPGGALLALDFDGTLAPIVTRPEDARPAPGVREALTALLGRVGCCALVSGRSAEDVARRSSLGDLADLVIAGNYGLEVWRAGALRGPPPAPAIAAARQRLPALLADAPDGVHLEDKTQALVVHTRPAARPVEALEALRGPLAALAAELGLQLVPGRLVLELRPGGVDKGSAVRELVETCGARSVLYAGDDVGDLPAFAAVRDLRGRGIPGLGVLSADPGGAGETPGELAGAADLTLPGPAGVVAFLSALAARLPPRSRPTPG